MNEGGIRPAVVSICMNLFICAEPTPLSATAGEDQAVLLTLVKSTHMGFEPSAGLKDIIYSSTLLCLGVMLITDQTFYPFSTTQPESAA